MLGISVPEKDINDVKVPKEGIIAVKASISLGVGDTIVGSLSCEHKVVYIDYIYDMVVVASENGNTDVLSFNDIAGHFQRVVK